MWRDNASDTEVVALFHPHGYGTLGAGADPDEASEGLHLSADGKTVVGSDGTPVESGIGNGDCVRVEAAGVAVCYAWNSDNRGPHDFGSAMAIFKAAQSMFPKAKIQASDGFDDFVSAVWPYRETLPVVTQEIGDTWIQGASSDPLKVAQYRAISRARASCIASGQCDVNADDFQTFDRLLMKVGEHTWVSRQRLFITRYLARPFRPRGTTKREHRSKSRLLLLMRRTSPCASGRGLGN